MIKPQPEHPPEVLARIVRVEPGAALQVTATWRGRFIFEPPRPPRPDAREKGWARKRYGAGKRNVQSEPKGRARGLSEG